jgi:hypothetical protein
LAAREKFSATANKNTYGFAWSGNTSWLQNPISELSSFKLVITKDKSKWTRCPVFETGDDANFAEGNVEKGNLRAAPSVDKDGNPDGDGTGMSWFPGYAINVETGERLNIGFGESSRLAQDNGRDMKFNPSSRLGFIYFSSNDFLSLLGGKHFIYVFNHSGNTVNDMPRYDKGEFIGFIEANSAEKKCFDPILITDPRDAPEPRTTAADVLQILKTKLGLLFPTDTPITIFDGAHKPETSSETAPTMISPFHVLRGGDAFYEKYGYVSTTINDLKHKLTTFTWGSCTEEAKKIVRDCTGKDYDPLMLLMDIMKTINWEMETAFNNRSPPIP